MSFTLANIPRYSLVLLLVVIVFSVFSFWWASDRPSEQRYVTTDLKELSPDVVSDPGLTEVINHLSKGVEQRFLLAVEGDKEGEVVDALGMLRQSLSPSVLSSLPFAKSVPLLSIVDSDTVLTSLLPLLKANRFNFLTLQQQQQLESVTDENILKLGRQQLYGFSSVARAAPLLEDPFNFFSEYLNQLVQKNSHFGEVAKTTDGRYFALVAVDLLGNALQIDQQEMVNTLIDDVEFQLAKGFPEVDFYRSGVFFFAADVAMNSEKDIRFISIVSSVFVVVFLLFTFSSLIPLLIPLVSIVSGLGVAFLVSFSIFGSVHIITILFGASLVGVVLDYSIHYFYHLTPLLPNQYGKYDAGKTTNNSLYRAMLFSLLTSVIGYSALAFSDLVSLKRVAVFSGVGLVVAWLTVVALGALLVRRPFVIRHFWVECLLMLVQWPIQRILRPYLTLWLCLIVIAGALLLFVGVKHDDNPRTLFSPSSHLLQQEKNISSLISDYEPGQFLVVTGISEDSIYTRLNQLDQVLIQFPNNSSESVSSPIPPELYSIKNWLPSMQEQQSNYRLNQRLYGDDGLVRIFLKEVGAETDGAKALMTEFKSKSEQRLSPQKLVSVLNAFTPPLWMMIAEQSYAVVRIPKGVSVKPLVDYSDQHDDVIFINIAKQSQQALQEQRHGAATMLVLAYIFIALLLLLRYRRIRSICLLLVPICATLSTFIVLALLNEPLTLFHYMGLFLVLGLGMDYVIFIAEIHNGVSSKKCRHSTTMQAILLSSITSLLSFGLLSLSSLSLVSGFGLTVLIGNAMNLILTIACIDILNPSSIKNAKIT